MPRKALSINVHQAIGLYSQWAIAHLHPRSARSLCDRLASLDKQAAGISTSLLTSEVLEASVVGSHPERTRLAQESFIQFCQAQGWPRSPNILSHPESPVIPAADWQALMTAIPGNHWYSTRDRLVFHLLYTIGLPLEDIRLLTRWTLTPSRLRHDGQWVALPDEVESAVLEWYGCRFGYGSNPVFINPSATPDPLLVRTLNRHLKRYCFIAGITPIITVYKLHEAGRVHGLLARRAMAQGVEPAAPSGTGLLGLSSTAIPSGDLL